jgi:hypothetical protein
MPEDVHIEQVDPQGTFTPEPPSPPALLFSAGAADNGGETAAEYRPVGASYGARIAHGAGCVRDADPVNAWRWCQTCEGIAFAQAAAIEENTARNGPPPVMYPGPAESPEISLKLFTRQVWRAELEKDWYALSALRLAVERDLRERGIPQWTDTARGLEQMAQYVNRDEMYLVREGPSATGCFALTACPDPDFWSDDPEKDECLYLQKVITAPWAARSGMGRFIVDYATSAADERCCSAVRLNCWEGNGKLREHFESLGFTYLRTATTRNRSSGVLMEKRLVPAAVTATAATAAGNEDNDGS